MSCSFLLNGEKRTTCMSGGSVVLDLLRRELHLTGTREGCREGDCGACTVRLGTPVASGVSYMAVNSCILPVAELQGRHLVTIEGLSREKDLTSVQSAFVEQGASQCGFCTPGMVVSMTGYLLSTLQPEVCAGIDALGGNICRCTGYVSVRRAIEAIIRQVGPSPAADPASMEHQEFLVARGVLPDFIPGAFDHSSDIDEAEEIRLKNGVPVAGGTDLFPLRSEELRDSSLILLSRDSTLKGIRDTGDEVVLGAAVTVSELMESGIFRNMGDFQPSLGLVASRQIRNRATLGGNIVNASPIGDLTIMLLALSATVRVRGGASKVREMPLKLFFKGYKDLDLYEDELLESVSFPCCDPGRHYSFEKVSLREYMDIASVNSAAVIAASDGVITSADISAGGVAPIPLYLGRTSEVLKGRRLERGTADLAAETAMQEVSPIDDVRGSANYKRTLLGRLVRAHFIKLIPVPETG